MNVQQAKEVLRGPMISVATPFDSDFRVDYDALRHNIRFMIDHGITRGNGTLLVAAAGGEFPMLTREERRRVMEVSVEAARGQVPIVASIQSNSSQEAVDLAREAHEAGVAVGQLSGPYYYRPSQRDVFRHFQVVSEKAELPLMIYSNWWVAGDIGPDLVVQIAELPTVVAVKWSAPSPWQYTEGLMLFAERLAVVDNALQLVQSHMLGAVGFITHIGNFWPEYVLGLWGSLQQKDYADVTERLKSFKLGWRRWAMKAAQETEGEGPFIKAAMEEVGLPAGPPRPPAAPVSDELRGELKQLFAASCVPRVAEVFKRDVG